MAPPHWSTTPSPGRRHLPPKIRRWAGLDTAHRRKILRFRCRPHRRRLDAGSRLPLSAHWCTTPKRRWPNSLPVCQRDVAFCATETCARPLTCILRRCELLIYIRCSDVIRTSVFVWWTVPDLRLIYGWHVTTLRVNCPLWVNRSGQLSLPSFRGR